MAKLRIGSRGSQLALWQANHVAALLRAKGHTVEIEVIKTTGDKITSVALAQVGTKGMFTNGIEELPQRAKVGTSSLRRQCQLKAMRPDLEVFPLRGNVDTRLRKLESGDYHAIILAAAGVLRLG